MPKKRGGVSLKWRGPEVQASVLEATRKAIDETMGDASVEAQQNTPVRTGTLKRSIRPHQPAQVQGTRVEGEWGSHDVGYAIFVEVGTSNRSGRHMLTNAADQEYPKLAGRIKKRLP